MPIHAPLPAWSTKKVAGIITMIIALSLPFFANADTQTPVCSATTTQPAGTSGSQNYNVPGAYAFTIPAYTGILKVEIWGGGGGGLACYRADPILLGNQSGSLSSWNNVVIANGGGAATPWTGGYANGGVGGSASGGGMNEPGTDGNTSRIVGNSNGGASPFGGAGGTSSNPDGSTPGAGGGAQGGDVCSAGGGGGGYSSVAYSADALSAGAHIPVVIGTGGAGNYSSSYRGGAGAPGTVKITWTATGQTLSLCAAGYELKNGTCVSTAVCATCPAGQSLQTTPGATIAPTMGGGAPGSQTYSTPGTYTFTVPNYAGNLNVTVNGGGGGGGGVGNAPGGAGGDSNFGGTVVAHGGGGGGESLIPSTGATVGSPGTASGGNVSNTTGGGASGGTGGVNSTDTRGNPYGHGGSGGKAVSAYSSGSLSNTFTVIVGPGGKGTNGGSPGFNGSVTVTWTNAGTLSCPSGYTLQGSNCVAPSTTQCVPDTTCSAGFHFDLLTNQCILNAPTICANGFHLDTATNQCVPDDDIILEAATTAWGFASLIHWQASAADSSCVGEGFDTGGATEGTVTTAPLRETTTFTLTCDTGTRSVTVVIDSCPVGYVGTPPVCTLDSNTCPLGYTGTPPNCSVASSCPLNFEGTPPNCTPIACFPANVCSGNDVVNSCTGEIVQTCAAPGVCSGGGCIIPAPTVVSWSVTPKLVRSGNTTNVSWEVTGAASCTVTGTNGDSWTGLTGTKVSRAIPTQTVFTLHCFALQGSGAADVTRTTTVNILPTFQEK